MLRKTLAALAVALVALVFTGPAQASPGGNDHDDKVWVCKYTTTPGGDEVLKKGNDGLVWVNKNAIGKDNPQVGDEFPDNHGKSIVIQIGGSNPGIESCPGYEPPFNWDWRYDAPSCDALIVKYPSNIPAGQANDVNVKFKNLATNATKTLNFHKDSGTWSGTKTFDFKSHSQWPGWTYYAVTWVQVAGTNYHWQGEIICGQPAEKAPKVEYGKWKDGKIECGATEVTQTRTKTVTPYKWKNGQWVLDHENKVVTQETQVRTLAKHEIKPCYVIVAWRMGGWNNNSPVWTPPQKYVTHEKQSTPNLNALDSYLNNIGWGCYQIDIYYDDETTAALIAGGVLYGPNNPTEHLIPGGLGTAWKFKKVGNSCNPPKPGPKSGEESWDTQECVDPLNGTAKKVTWKKTWTQQPVWNATTQTWDWAEKVYSGPIFVKKVYVDDESCIPGKPDPYSGEELLPESRECVEPGNGTAYLYTWKKTWTQDWSWNQQLGKWELQDKVYSDPFIDEELTQIVNAEECIPDKPEGLNGTETYPPTYECVVPYNGKSTVTTTARDWTQDYEWDWETLKWVLQDKVYGETYVVSEEEIDSELCEPPSLEGTIVASQCVDDVPWIEYDVKLNDPNGLSTDDGTATFTFTAPGKSETFVKTVPIGSGKFLWPGATATDNGDGSWTATGWPGWAYIDDEWVSVGDDNFGWTRDGVDVEVEVNPTLTVHLNYPPPTPLCVAGPPTEVHNELDAPPADAVEAEAQYAG